jgi:signal transduction histidine kinase
MTHEAAAARVPARAWLRRAGELAVAGGGRRPTMVSSLVSAALLVAMLTTASVHTGTFAVPGPALLVATVASWLPLLARDARPVPALLGATLVEAAHLVLLPVGGGQLMGAYQPVPIATMAGAAVLAARVPRRIGWPAGIGAGAVLLVAGVLSNPGALRVTDMVTFNLVLIATAGGAWVTARRDRRDQQARERAEDARQAVADERLRIARELHDVLAHTLTLVNAQASVAEYLLRSDPPAAATALHDIAAHTSRALEEVRATVGLLRGAGDDAEATAQSLAPVPGLDGLDDLVASFRSAGAVVALEVTGEAPAVAQPTDLAAYRIVQEALTNATKHAAGAPVTVRLAWLPGRLEVEVVNALRPGARPGPGTGHGLIGMRERAVAAGGTLDAGPVPGGRFRVAADLPLGISEEGAVR